MVQYQVGLLALPPVVLWGIYIYRVQTCGYFMFVFFIIIFDTNFHSINTINIRIELIRKCEKVSVEFAAGGLPSDNPSSVGC